MSLSGKQRRQLRARGHGLSPAVTVGASGLTDSVRAEIERALLDHELIKIRLNEGDRADRNRTVKTLCEHTGADHVQSLGRTALLFRIRPRDGE